jgi:surface carbohydrate biosynthesis protein (TIGR04326 family)
MTKNLILWDLERKLEFTSDYTILWNSFSENKEKKIFSINNLIGKKEDYYKGKILNFVSSIKDISINKKNVNDLMKINQDFSFWWFSKIYEKCNEIKTPELNDLVKVFALEDFLEKKKIQKIKIFTKNSNLIEYLELFAQKKKITLFFESKKRKKYKSINFFCEGIATILINFLKNIFFVKKKLSWMKNYNLYLSYFSQNKKNFISKNFNQEIFWNNILKLENKNNLIVMIPDDNISILNKFFLSSKINNQKKNKNFYISIYNFLDINILIKSIALYLKHFWKLKKIISNNFFLKNKNPYLILMKEKFLDDIIGKNIAISILHYLIFEKIFNSINNPKKIIFLQEYQSWERILIFLSKKKFNINTFGYAHSSIRFWDLRYFNSFKDLNQNKIALKKISPDVILVNSRYQKKVIHKNSISSIKICESSRYLNYKFKKNIKLRNNSNSILVIFDGLKKQDIYLIDFLNKVYEKLEKKYIFICKIHHLTDLRILKKIKFNHKIETKPLYDIKKNFKFICLGPGTSAAIDLAFLKIKFVTLLNPNTMNLSPVKNENFTFIRNVSEFIHYFNKPNQIKVKKINFININQKLNEWKKIIA